MQRVLSHDIWREIGALARKARRRQAAIAYVTLDLLHLKRGDDLITNASPSAIACGQTDAKLLERLYENGVNVYDCDDLHAKVVLLDDVAVIGSANMSSFSAGQLVEAGVLTDHHSVVAGVASLIEQLRKQARPLEKQRLAVLCRIKVIRTGGRPRVSANKRATRIDRLGNQTWIIGVRELSKDPPAAEQKLIDLAGEKLGQSPDDLEWLRWGTKGRFARECRQGDVVIQIWRSSRARRPSAVFRGTPVLLKQTTRKWVRFYISEPQGGDLQLPWGKFKRLLAKLGYPRQVGPNVAQLVSPELADAISRTWPLACSNR
jgi:hypothetical protein